MNNTFQTSGTVQFLNLRETSLFMTIREEGSHGAFLRIKAFCPKDQQNAPDMWLSQFNHLSVGAQVQVEGSLANERVTTQGADGSRVDVLHPVTGKPFYEPYIWAWNVREYFNPVRHALRTDAPAASRPQRPEPPSAPAPSAGRQQSAASSEGDELPPMPPNDGPIQRANVSWN